MAIIECVLKHEADGAWSIVDEFTKHPIVINKVTQSGLEFYVAQSILHTLKREDIEPHEQMVMSEIMG